MRFTIRDVLWVMVVAALALGWWVDRSSLRQRIQRFENAGRWFALSIDGPGYFPLIDPQTKSVVFRRSDYVSLNRYGQLFVRGVEAEEWLLEPTITIPLGEPFSIQPDGSVFVRTMTTPSGDPAWVTVGKLPVALFAHPDKLRTIGPGMYVPTDESGPPKLTTAGENGAGFVRHSF